MNKRVTVVDDRYGDDFTWFCPTSNKQQKTKQLARGSMQQCAAQACFLFARVRDACHLECSSARWVRSAACLVSRLSWARPHLWPQPTHQVWAASSCTGARTVACVQVWALVLRPCPSLYASKSCPQCAILRVPTRWTMRGGVETVEVLMMRGEA
jgi:hypothetical protein